MRHLINLERSRFPRESKHFSFHHGNVGVSYLDESWMPKASKARITTSLAVVSWRRLKKQIIPWVSTDDISFVG